jgi:hypothetical protein
MTNALDSARFMLARAKHHLADLEGQIRAFIQEKPFGHITEDDANTGERVRKLRLIKPMPVMLNGIASDAICNIRSALDQTTFAVSKDANPSGKGRNTYFPIGENLPDFNGRKSGGSSEVPDEIFDVLLGFEPYGTGKGAVMWTLSRLGNANKHRMLQPIAVATQDAPRIRFTG